MDRLQIGTRGINLEQLLQDEVLSQPDGSQVVRLTFAAAASAIVPRQAALAMPGAPQELELLVVPFQVVLSPAESREYLRAIAELTLVAPAEGLELSG